MSKRILAIQNPVSGTIYNKFKFYKIVKNLKENYEIIIKNTTSTMGADEIIRYEQEKYDYILVCGGDGTLNQVITEISNDKEKKKPIIYIPLGTTNDFGKSLNISNHNLIKNINEFTIKKCDTGIVNQKKYFNYIAAAGLFTISSYDTSIKAKRVFGRLAYIINGIKDIFKMKEYEAKIQINDKIINDKFIYMSISNSYSIGGFDIFKKDEIELDDGMFEILLVKKPKNIIELTKLARKIISKNHVDNNIIFIQSKKAIIRTKEKLNWTFDGENSGKYNEINIKNMSKNIEFIINK